VKYPTVPEATLLIGRNESSCNACGGAADLNARSHDVLLGYGPSNGQPGCGVTWTHVAATYTGTEDAVRQMRPDLEFVQLFPDRITKQRR
jgi:hypothetical protein